jgi:hypothetical protein
MLWIENIVESTQARPILTNSNVNIVRFVNPHPLTGREKI